MTDEEFLAAFENCTLPYSEWTHEAHIRAAYLYASRSKLNKAIDQMRHSIQAYNKATGTPDAIDRGYHETITQAFMHLVFAANKQTGPHQTAQKFCDTHPELLTKYVLKNFYSREHLMTREAKTRFVEPDLSPLPDAGQPIDQRGLPPGNASVGHSENLTQQLSNKEPSGRAKKTEIRALTGHDAHEVSELAIRSKSVWGYNREQMAVFREELTMTPGQLDSRIAYGICIRKRLIGFYTILAEDKHTAELEHLFVDPEHLKQGLGRTLLNHAISHCQSLRFQEITVLSDPNAGSFYERCGAQLVEHIPSSIPGRTIPRYRIPLST